MKVLSKFLLLVTLLGVIISESQSQRTNFVDEDSKVSQYFESQWFKDNIPFIEVPVKEIEDIYYYRFTTLKRHLRYILPGVGYMVTEFVHRVGYAQKFDTINAAAGHHIEEARWLKNTRYIKDYINIWTRESAGTHQYSEWIADAAYNAFLVNGDADFIKSQQEGFVNNFDGWDDHFERSLNLYRITPEWDAMEQSASSLQTDDPYGGGLGYRPSFNSEMYANAVAITKIAILNGDTATATLFQDKAEAIRRGINEHLWDKDRKFYYHMQAEDNPNMELLDTREEIGFFTWRWEVPDKGDPQYELAWESLFDPLGFDTEYGPTTCEQRSKWFDGNQTSACCFWNGNSWPYSTGMTLKSLAAQVKRYSPTALVNVDSFVAALKKYATTQYKNGKPYIAECHSPYNDNWVCDRRDGSEHYAHSTYVDNVLSDLIGIEPQADDTFQVNPLVPSSWTYFIAENIPYHGHLITVLYDADGTKYNTGFKGLQIFVNGQLTSVQEQIGLMKVVIPAPVKDSFYQETDKVENYAANALSEGYPKPEASFISRDANVWDVINGRIFYDYIPIDRWTNYDSPNEQDWFSVDFGNGRKRRISQVKMYIYSDYAQGLGGVDCPTSIDVQYLDGGNWVSTENQLSTPAVCVPNDVWIIDFQPITTQKIRLVFERNVAQNTYIGLNELEIWAPWPQPQSSEDNVYEAEDGYIARGSILESSSASGGSYVGLSDQSDAVMEFTGIWRNSSGDATVRIHYANSEGSSATMRLLVNNIHTDLLTFPQTTNGAGGFDPETFLTFPVQFQRGNNVIILRHEENFVEIDKLTILP